MIGWVNIGANDLDAAVRFYDTVLEPLGAGRGYAGPGRQAFGVADGGTSLVVCTPHDGGPATGGNGTMVSLRAASHEVVDKVHAAALAAGGRCEGPPGVRQGTFYAAYFRDLDGNKLCAFNQG